MDILGKYIKVDDPRFPARLVGIKPTIKGLWYKGELGPKIFNKTVAIVGSRRMSQYGKRVLGEFVPRLVREGYTTVSGFMYGIDIEMHRLTVENGGKTVGVLGWGIEYPINPENNTLYHKVLESGGLFLSEMKPNEAGKLWSFPQRNRIVVGLADLVLVVEAGRKSGSLNSAEWARKQGKPVYAVPGSVFSSVSEGCNWLLETGRARPMTIDFFVEQKYSKKVSNNQTKGQLTKVERILVTRLTLEGPQSVNELARGLGIPAGEISAMLTTLLLRGVVEEERGLWRVS